MKLSSENVKYVAERLSNFTYRENYQATKELIELFERIHPKLYNRSLQSLDDVIRLYDSNFYTYKTWKELVDSEKEQSDGLTEEELKRELEDNKHGSVWKLPCGWYVQYVQKDEKIISNREEWLLWYHLMITEQKKQEKRF